VEEGEPLSNDDLAGLRFLNSLANPDGPQPVGWNLYSGAAERDVTKPLEFREFIPNEREVDRAAERLADEVGLFAFTVAQPKCRAVCFAPDTRLKDALKWACIADRIAVSPVDAAYLNSPVLGPTPLRCELDEHPAGTWHREGRTWFR
jgi:hypothetical protein